MPRNSIFDSQKIAERFSAGIKDVSCWSNAIEPLALATKSCRIVFLPIEEALPVAARGRKSEAKNEAFRIKDWVGSNLIGQRTARPCQNNKADAGELCRSATYSLDCCERQSMRYLAGIRVSVGEDPWCLIFSRCGKKEQSFSDLELSELQKLSHDLSRLATEAQALGLDKARSIIRLFETMAVPALLLDRHCKVVGANRFAERFLGKGRLSIRHDRITCTPALSQALDELTRNSKTPLAVMAAQPVEGGALTVASTTRLDAISNDAFARYWTVLTFLRSDEHPRPSEDVLSRLFGLSKAEARLASGVASGKSLKALAVEFGISKETARRELKFIFDKVQVHRQAELVALLSVLRMAPGGVKVGESDKSHRQ